MTEEKALKLMQRGNTRGLEWLIERYTPYVSTIIHNVIGSSLGDGAVEETASDVFFALWSHAGNVKPESLKAYVGKTARNMALTRLRGASREVALEEDMISLNIAAPENDFEQRELEKAVRKAVDSMTEPDREIFLRHYFCFQNVGDVAKAMAMSESAVKSRLMRGREKLRRVLEDEVN